MRNWQTLLLALGLLPFAVAAGHAAPLHVMSFNIRGDFDLEKASDSSEAWNSTTDIHRRDMVTKVIGDAHPDLFGVQEAYRHQLADLQKALPDYEFVGVGRDDGKTAGEHSAIFYDTNRFRRIDAGNFWLSDTPDKPGSKHPDAACVRIASWVVLADSSSNNEEVFVLDTHWDHISEPARLDAAKLIRSRLPALAGSRPAIVMGDFNAHEEDPAVKTLIGGPAGAGLQLTDSFREVFPQRGEDEASFHAFEGNPAGSRIDFILHTDQLRATDAAIIRTKFGDRYPSDHFPVTATLVPGH